MPDINTNVTPSAAEIGYGSIFAIGVASGGTTTYTEVAEVKEIKPSGITVGEVDKTHLRSPGAVREFAPTVTDPGTLELSGNYIGDTSQDLMESTAIARTVFPFKYTFPLTGKIRTVTGTCFFTKFGPGDITLDKVSDFSATFRVTGITTHTDDTTATTIS